MRSTGSWYDVRTDDGRIVACKVKGKFRLQGIRSTNPVAVGDGVTDGFNLVVQAVFFQLFQQYAYCTGVVVTAGQSSLAFFTVFVERDDCFGRTQAFTETAQENFAVFTVDNGTFE